MRVLNLIGLADLAGMAKRDIFSFWAVIFLTFFLFGDQNLISSNMSRIGADMGFPDEKDYLWYIGSLVSILFFIVGGLFSLCIGILTDQWDRKKLVMFVVLVGELPGLLTAFAPNYPTFVVLRTLTGFGLGGIMPVVFSLVGDYFKAENRATAAAWVGLAMGLGIAVGQLMAGAVAHETIWGLPGWRFSFLAMALPAFPMALLYYLYGTVPGRGMADEAGNTSGFNEHSHKVTWSDFRKIFKTRTNVFGFLQGIPGTVPWAFLFVYLVEYYEVTKKFHVQQANLLVMAFGGTAIMGGFLGGFIGRFLYRKNKKLLPAFGGVAIILGSIPTFLILNYEGRAIAPMLLMALVGGAVSTLASPILRAILLNVNAPENRGSVFATYNLTDDLGKGLGPFFIGLLLLFMDKVVAYNFAVSLWIVSGLLWFPMIFSLEKDEAAAKENAIRKGQIC